MTENKSVVTMEIIVNVTKFMTKKIKIPKTIAVPGMSLPTVELLRIYSFPHLSIMEGVASEYGLSNEFWLSKLIEIGEKPQDDRWSTDRIIRDALRGASNVQ